MSGDDSKKVPIEVPRTDPEQPEKSFAEKDLEKAQAADALLKKEPDNKPDEPDMVACLLLLVR